MKEVFAVIRMNMMNQTKRALTDAGITSMHAKDCLGRGKGIEEGAARNEDGSAVVTGRLLPKRMINVVVPDKLVKTVVTTIIKVNQSGKSGDGKIFVLPVSDAYRVRTGEEGDDVLDI